MIPNLTRILNAFTGEWGEGVSSGNEGDGTNEMALIAASFKKSATTGLISIARTAQEPVEETEEPESSDNTSQDLTLSEIRDQTRTERSQEEPGANKVKRTNRSSRRGVPMREESFKNIGWTRSFIFVPADPVHNPLMVWCHICKLNFCIKTK